MGLALVHWGFRAAHCRVKPMHRNRVSPWLLSGALLLSGCATVKSYWPFGHSAQAAPQPVSELLLQLPADGTAPVVLQFWERNTLVVDLQNVPSAGRVVLARREGNDWPARIAFRMAPNRFEVLEVRGAQRVLLPVAAAADTPVVVELPPGTYAGATTLAVSWGAKGAF
jgi:hypothetical protein